MSKPWAGLQYIQDHREVVAEARSLLATERDPLDRHATWVFLERALYALRDSGGDAHREFENACEAHHAEMASIRPAMIGEFGGVLTLWTHRQMAIHKKKTADYEGGAEWCRRGLRIYGSDVIPQDRSMVEDLTKRLAWFERKI